MSPFLTKILVILWFMLAEANEESCPTKCICRRNNQRDNIKLKCGDNDNKIQSLDEIDLLNIASEVVQFNLSNNLLTTFYLKVQLTALQKLDLSKNKLTELSNNQFSELPNLRRLDISSNSIRTIKLLAFSQLSHLERLKLNQNQVGTIALGTFDPLVNLKQLDISSNPLTCDCSLLWLLDWSQKRSIKLVSNPTCAKPPSFQSHLLRKLKIGVHIFCKSPVLTGGFPMIALKPDNNQVVFEGDSLRLRCSAPSISDTPTSAKLEWDWLDSDPKVVFADDVSVENDFLQSKGLAISTLRISKLKRNHTGIWSCLLASRQGNHSKGITVVVISEDTEYCPITVTSDNKGTYTWPRTVVNYTATMPCESVNLNFDVSQQKATYVCSGDGRWDSLNTSMCSYTSESTKILEQFSKVNSSVAESAKHFRNYSSNKTHFRDVMDVVFAVETMENYLKYIAVDQVGGVLMDVINNLSQLPKAYLRQANYEYGSCVKLVNITEKLAAFNLPSQSHKGPTNIVTDMLTVQKVTFSGLKCTWYIDRPFTCSTNSQNDAPEPPGSIIEASITIPDTLFQQLEDQNYQMLEKNYKILIAMYVNNKLFPVDAPRDIRTAVIGAKLVNITVANLTDPIVVMLRTPPPTFSESAPLVPVWWDSASNNGTGGWSPEGCHFYHEYVHHTLFVCHNFGYYGLMQDVSTLETSTGAKFKLSHPAIYVGSFILFASFLVAIVTYLMCYPTIQMPKKAKHSLINLWIAVCFLCFLYVFGIYQTEDVRICQIVGMLLHYFTLSSLLWMCVGVNCMYKRLSKNDVMELQDDELPSDQPVKKPILGLYFVGWGVATIVCGISAAINIREYASPDYCFLRMGPPLSALYIPVAILIVFLVIFFLLIRCAIYSLDANGHLSEGTQATENVDLDLLEPNFPNSDVRSVLSASSKTASSEVEDPEHAPSAQLKAYVIFLCIYVLAWLSCAFATTETYRFVSFEDDLFSIAYAMLSTVLSAFTIFFYCVARSDVRGQWILLCRWMRSKHCFRSRNVSDAAQNVPHIQIQSVPPVSNSLMGELQITSRSSSRSSGRTKSNSHNSNILKAAVDLNGPSYSSEGTKINNVNLIVLHRQQYRTSVIPNIIENPTSAAEVFYNPHQSIVARKFFKRQKRHMMKRNNLVPRPRDSDSASVMSTQIKDNSTIDQSIFGTNSKVNNTNIHVEHPHKKHQKNPNLFSDSGDEFDRNVPIHKIVLTAERLRRRDKSRKKLNRSHPVENNMRSVSQQCTLEYSSENISDSILDKTSPDKEQETKTKEGSLPRIYVNPGHDFHLLQKNKASSVSVSDLDELYQQIRRGPRAHQFNLTRNSPCLSESDINSYVTRRSASNLSENETTV